LLEWLARVVGPLITAAFGLSLASQNAASTATKTVTVPVPVPGPPDAARACHHRVPDGDRQHATDGPDRDSVTPGMAF
jgi:hypothetical protein